MNTEIKKIITLVISLPLLLMFFTLFFLGEDFLDKKAKEINFGNKFLYISKSIRNYKTKSKQAEELVSLNRFLNESLSILNFCGSESPLKRDECSKERVADEFNKYKDHLSVEYMYIVVVFGVAFESYMLAIFICLIILIIIITFAKYIKIKEETKNKNITGIQLSKIESPETHILYYGLLGALMSVVSSLTYYHISSYSQKLLSYPSPYEIWASLLWSSFEIQMGIIFSLLSIFTSIFLYLVVNFKSNLAFGLGKLFWYLIKFYLVITIPITIILGVLF